MRSAHLMMSIVVGLSALNWSCSSSPGVSKTSAFKAVELHTPLSYHGPNRLIVMVFDAMKPEYIDRFNLTHFKKLRSLSKNYHNAYLGYIGAETSVSHLVLPYGRKPKDLPIQDDIIFDSDGKLGSTGAFYSTGGLSIDQLRTLMASMPENTDLGSQLKKKFGGKTIAIGEKNYATTEFGTLSADSIITMKKEWGQCVPDGINVPSYISIDYRYRIECAKKYGTEDSYYPLDGAKSVPGDDKLHLGGDIWVTDVALEVMKNESWSGLFLTMSGIDKVTHMLGEVDPKYVPPQIKGIKTEYHLDTAAKIADEQLGRIMDELEKRKLLDKTIIVATADHGSQVDKKYLGNGKTSKWGVLKNESAKDAPEWVTHVVKAGEVAVSYQDTAMRVWMKTRASNRKPVIKAMSEVPGVTEVYALEQKKNQWSYHRVFTALGKQPKKFQSWANQHSKEILNATATKNSPDLIGLLADETGFDLIGDHGGAQEGVQRIPLMIVRPKNKGAKITRPIRMSEVKKEILKEFLIESK